jgi:acetylornithine deacetylase/succinyl-diaminopimelate desuccinylase-like protein
VYLSFLENCRKLVALDSTPAHGNSAAAAFVAGLCQEAGLFVEVHRETMEGLEQCNVIARPGSSAVPPREIMLQTHLDTPDGGHFAQWTKTQSNPFNASIYGDELYGLGVADVKLDFLCKLEAARELAGRNFKTPFVLVGTFGAHSGMAGAIKLIRRKKLSASLALIGEPTDMRLINAGKGMAVIEISLPFSQAERDYRRDHDLQESASTQSRMFSGKAAHSSDPTAGDNAIMKMLEYLAQLPDGVAIMDLDGGTSHNSVPANAVLEIDTIAGFEDPMLPKLSRLYSDLRRLEQELMTFREDGFSPAHATMNLGMIRSTEADVRLTGSVRLPPTVPDEVYEGWMRRLESAVKAVGATFYVRDYRKGFRTSADGKFTKTVQSVLADIGLNSELAKVTQSSEASVFTRHGIECLLWGPGRGVGNSHAPNERVSIADLKTAIKFYRLFLERFCL